MTPQKIYDLLIRAFGEVLGRLIGMALCWLMIAAFFRLYALVDGQVSGGIDPVKFALISIMAFIVFQAWHFFAVNDLDE